MTRVRIVLPILIATLAATLVACAPGDTQEPAEGKPILSTPSEQTASSSPVAANPDPIAMLQMDPNVRAVEATIASTVTTATAIATLTKRSDLWRPAESTVTIVARKVYLNGKRHGGRLVWVVGAGPLWVMRRGGHPVQGQPSARRELIGQMYIVLDAMTGEVVLGGQAGTAVR